jgi:hypothetical protein
MYIFCVLNKTACLPEVAHVEPGAENAHQLIFVVVNVSLHNVHARSHQTLKRLHVQNCREMKSINGIKLSLLFKKKTYRRDERDRRNRRRRLAVDG